jgi:transcriptional regulator with XRE-family HTH domain
MNITGARAKSARLLLGWDVSKMAAETHVSSKTISVFENGKTRVSTATLAEVRYVLEKAGIEFVEGEPGVKLRKIAQDNPAPVKQASSKK